MSMESAAFRRHVTEQAAHWFASMQQPRPSQDEREAFTRWLEQSAGHVEEYLAVVAAWRASEQAASPAYTREALIEAARRDLQAGTVTSMRPEHAPAFISSRRGHWPVFAAAAGVAAAAIIAGWMFLKPDAVEYRTHDGDRLTALLADGSTVRLNSRTHVRIDFSAASRSIELLEGEALFDVARDTHRPFRVRSDDSEIRAIGTAFNVVRAGDVTTVTVIEGRVEVAPVTAGARDARDVVLLEARQQASVGGKSGAVARDAVDVQAVTSWTQPVLRFSNEPLRAVIAQFNQYNSRQLVLDDERLGAIRISGVFSSSDLPSFIEYLQRTEQVRLEETGPTTSVLRGPAVPAFP